MSEEIPGDWHGGYRGNKETEGIKIEKFVGSPVPILEQLQIKDMNEEIKECESKVKHAETAGAEKFWKNELKYLEEKRATMIINAIQKEDKK